MVLVGSSGVAKLGEGRGRCSGSPLMRAGLAAAARLALDGRELHVATAVFGAPFHGLRIQARTAAASLMELGSPFARSRPRRQHSGATVLAWYDGARISVMTCDNVIVCARTELRERAGPFLFSAEDN